MPALLRASDFCRPANGVNSAAPKKNGGRTTTTRTTNHGKSQGVRVHVHVPIIVKADMDGESQRHSGDQHVVYASSTKVLRDAGLIVGRWAWLSLLLPTTSPISIAGTSTVDEDYFDTNRSVSRRIAVRVELKLRPSPSPSSSSSASVDNRQDEAIYVSYLTALNLGWDLADRSVGATTATIVPMQHCLSRKEGNFHEKTADQVTLRALGGPIHSSVNNQSPSWPFPTTGSVLQLDTLVSVRKFGDSTNCRGNGDNGNGDFDIFYYHVVAVNGNRNPCCGVLYYYVTTSRTIFQLESNRDASFVPRLPPTFRQPNNNTIPHPDVPVLLRCWQYPNARPRNGKMVLSPAQLVHHLIGTEADHHTVTAVQYAAALAGRTCWIVPGLAAAAHLWDPSANDTEMEATVADDQHRRSRHVVSTGSIVDKLAGLQIALERAWNYGPAVLLIPNLHQELSQDATQRHEEEGRIWSLLVDQLHQFSMISSRDPLNASHLPHIPRLLIVVTTDAPLSPGPLRQNLVMASVSMSLPDRAYAGFVWNHSNMKNKVADMDGKRTCTAYEVCDDALQELLRGRTVREILELRHEWNWQTTNGNGSNENSNHLLREIFLRYDNKRRHKSSLNRIPEVHWEDVGGLANVRLEIMNTIEIPLQHPHLFGSLSSARSSNGILLYGPPGTGKTLVAKAVATECGLPFLSVKGPSLLASFVGESEAQVRGVFEQARTLASANHPAACVLFFDELDSLAPRRGDQASGGNVMDRVVATLFTELDKINAKCEGLVFCIGATNRLDLLDPALLRPGRLDRLVYLGISAADHANILAAQLRRLRLEGEALDLAIEIVKYLPANLTGADLSTVATGGLLRATERLCNEVDGRLLEVQVEQERSSANSLPTLQAPVSVNQLLASWDDEHLEPFVTLDDLLVAARQVVPSVSAAELEQYERLGQQYHIA